MKDHEEGLRREDADEMWRDVESVLSAGSARHRHKGVGFLLLRPCLPGWKGNEPGLYPPSGRVVAV